MVPVRGGGGGGGGVMCLVFKGKNQVEGTSKDRNNDQLKNPSTSLDVEFRRVSDGVHGLIFDRGFVELWRDEVSACGGGGGGKGRVAAPASKGKSGVDGRKEGRCRENLQNVST